MKYSIQELDKALELFGPTYQTEIDFFIQFLETNPLKKRSLIPKGGNDKIMTPPNLAKAIVDHFLPWGFCLEPCRGDGAFFDAMMPYARVLDYCEIDEGIDFLESKLTNYDWIITNPPFSKIRSFLIKSMQTAKNIVFLCPINHLLGLKARKRDIKQAGFYIQEICDIEKPKSWPSSGFGYAAIHLSRRKCDCKSTELIYVDE